MNLPWVIYIAYCNLNYLDKVVRAIMKFIFEKIDNGYEPAAERASNNLRNG